MKQVTFLVPRKGLGAFLKWLQDEGAVHLEQAHERLGEGDGFERMGSSPGLAEERLRQIEAVLALLDRFAPRRRSLVENFITVPLRVKRSEMEAAVGDFQLEPLHSECARLAARHHDLEKGIAEAEAELEQLRFFQELPFEPRDLLALRRVEARVGTLDQRSWEGLQLDPAAAHVMAVEMFFGEARRVRVCALALKENAEEATRILRQYGFAERPVPGLDVSVGERAGELRASLAEQRSAEAALRKRVVELAESRRQVEILQAYWQAERARSQALAGAAATRRIAALSGFMKAAREREFQARLEDRFPQVTSLYAFPRTGDNVPVSLRNSRLVQPLRFMVDLFGRPDYFSFDPTPFLSLSFVLFFGMCFGDVVYGLALCALMWYASRKAKGYEGLHNFTMMFFYCGISTVVFGVLTGSWASDLWKPQYLGEGNPLLWIKEHTAVVEPLDRALVLLVVSLAVGVVNQFYAVILKGYGLLRRGDVAGALFDAGLWLVMLPGFLILVSSVLFPMPHWLLRVGIALAAVGGAGLVLTQGRKEKGIVSKAVVGVVSLYGILGSYGCASFLSDVLSYARLLALGLTTGIVGMAFNLIAGMAKEVPRVGIALFIVVAVLGHSFNFAVSMLGAFVHPARLIFLEFFSRFYDAGGLKFQPLSLSTEGVIVD